MTVVNAFIHMLKLPWYTTDQYNTIMIYILLLTLDNGGCFSVAVLWYHNPHKTPKKMQMKLDLDKGTAMHVQSWKGFLCTAQ